MSITKLIIAVIIHFILPVVGLLGWLYLIKKMKSTYIPESPIIETFIAFATYGGLILVVLTELFWEWSGMASIGVFYLIFAAPIIMIIISYRNYKKRAVSDYHFYTYISGLLYLAIAPLTLALLIMK